MAMMIDAFVGKCVEKLAELVGERVAMILGVKEDLQWLQRRLEMIQGVLEDAERRRFHDTAINTWVKELKDVMYDADDIIDLCRIKGQKRGRSEEDDEPSSLSVSRFLPSFSSLSSAASNYDLENRIRCVNERLKEITEDGLILSRLGFGSREDVQPSGVNPRQTSPLVKSNSIVGRQTVEAAKRLVDSVVEAADRNILVFAIVGMGGIGKTTLAQKIYNDPRLGANFQARIWLCVSQKFSETELLKQMIRSAGGDHGQAQTKAELQPLLSSLLTGKRFFLVLDDVWRADVWEDLLQAPLEQEGSGGRILITTRDEDVAQSMRAVNTHRMNELPIDDGWDLLCKNVFASGEEEDMQNLREIGVKIVGKCGGLPLAIKVVAGVLRTKSRSRGEWEKVHRGHAWSLRAEFRDAVMGALYLSYEDLPSHLKQCFLYCSLLPEDYGLGSWNLIWFWVAEGFVRTQGDSLMEEDTAEDYYNELLRRNLLQPQPRFPGKNGCTMHDLLRSLARYLAQDECCLVGSEGSTPTTSLKLRRLSFADRGEVTTVLDSIKDPNCLRTLILFKSPQIKELEDVFQRFMHLRVLVLSQTEIERVPDSVRNLIHLRLLALNDTRVSELPESLGCLTNLQILGIARCKSLHTLPKSITQLCNLRLLYLLNTPLNYLPRGIRKLENLTYLKGFVVGDDGQQGRGCDLGELQSLSRLRTLGIDKLEKVQIGGVLPLRNKPRLKELLLSCTPQEINNDQEEIKRIEQIYENLFPPSTLESLRICNFFGLKYPSWMGASPSSCPYLSNLTQLFLIDCISCQQLPPLGQLLQLTILVIEGASAIVSIGQEFLGSGVRERPQGTASASFPKLELLQFSNMPNWEEWFCEGEVADGGSRISRQLLPRLEKLELVDCPKLRDIPEGLRHATSLQRYCIKGAHSLLKIENFPSMTQMHINNSRCLERLSNLPALRDLRIIECPALKYVENLDVLQWLWLEDDSMDCLPEWLLGLIQQQQQQQVGTHGPLQELHLRCNDGLRERCIEGGQYWLLLQYIPSISVGFYQQ